QVSAALALAHAREDAPELDQRGARGGIVDGSGLVDAAVPRPEGTSQPGAPADLGAHGVLRDGEEIRAEALGATYARGPLEETQERLRDDVVDVVGLPPELSPDQAGDRRPVALEGQGLPPLPIRLDGLEEVRVGGRGHDLHQCHLCILCAILGEASTEEASLPGPVDDSARATFAQADGARCVASRDVFARRPERRCAHHVGRHPRCVPLGRTRGPHTHQGAPPTTSRRAGPRPRCGACSLWPTGAPKRRPRIDALAASRRDGIPQGAVSCSVTIARVGRWTTPFAGSSPRDTWRSRPSKPVRVTWVWGYAARTSSGSATSTRSSSE